MDKSRSIFYHLDQWVIERKQSAETEAMDIPTQQKQTWLPTKGNMFFSLLLIAVLLIAQNLGVLNLLAAPNAQTVSTGTIAYQGRLANANGDALTETVNMSFRLYSTATDGAPLWEEQWTGTTSVQVSDGLFNVMLGSVSPIPQDVITGNSNLFLGITVGTDSEMSPRVQLGSVPFATQALTVPNGSITRDKLSAGNMLPVKVGNITHVPAGGANSEFFTIDISDLGLTAKPIGFAHVTNGSSRNLVLVHYSYDSSSATEAVFEFFRPDGQNVAASNLRFSYVLFGQ